MVSSFNCENNQKPLNAFMGGAILKADANCTCVHDSVKESPMFKSRVLFNNRHPH